MPAGRPTLLTLKIQAVIVRHIKLGMPVEYAAQAAGIVKQTLYNWKAKGQAEPDSAHGEFLDAVKKAEAELMAECLRAVKSGKSSWQSRAWILERKWPELWSTDRELLQELKRFLRQQKKERERSGIHVNDDPPAGKENPKPDAGTANGN